MSSFGAKEFYTAVSQEKFKISQYLPAVKEAMRAQGILSKMELQERIDALAKDAPDSDLFYTIDTKTLGRVLMGDFKLEDWSYDDKNPIKKEQAAMVLVAAILRTAPEDLFKTRDGLINRKNNNYSKKTFAPEAVGDSYRRGMDLDACVDKAGLCDTFREVLLTLTPKEERVLRFRFEYDQSPEKIGQALGIAKENIKNVEAKALRKLKHPSRSRKLRPYSLESNDGKYGAKSPFVYPTYSLDA